MSIIFLVLAFTLNAVANILLKISAGREIHFANMSLFKIISSNSILLTGLALFACNVVFYMLALRTLSLSVAYPVMVGMTFLMVSSFSFLYLKEDITLIKIIGYCTIFAGIVIISYFSHV